MRFPGIRLLPWVITPLYVGSLAREARRFSDATRAPRRAQERRLRQILTVNADSQFGREHDFARITSIREYQERVPVRDYVGLEPWIDRVARGERGILTNEPVRMFELTSGSTAANKLIPYTASFLEEFAAATGPWIFDLYRSCPALFGTRSYWSISPVVRERARTAGGIPIGFSDDTEYFDRWSRLAIEKLLVVPTEVARAPDMDTWRRRTLVHLLEAGDLGLFSIWSPTFLTLLMEALERDFDALVRELPKIRAAQVERAINGGSLSGERLWPRLALISCWAHGASETFISGLRRWFPRTRIQPKGLLATEGVVSIPVWGLDGSVLAVNSHFLEFLDLANPDRRPLFADEIEVGNEYSPILTTGAGLYRYHLPDVVRCVGLYRRTPLIQFLGKLDAVTDLCGEKVSARSVEAALKDSRAATGVAPTFSLLAPVRTGVPHYRLYVEVDAEEPLVADLAARVEQHLAAGHHYRYCRALGQLGPVEPVRVKGALARYQAAMVAAGKKPGDVKPMALDLLGISESAFKGVHPDEVSV